MNSVDIRTRLVEGAAIIYPGPYLNQLRGEDIENRCQELLQNGINRLVINFQETELINSIGISILLGVIEAVNDAKGYAGPVRFERDKPRAVRDAGPARSHQNRRHGRERAQFSL